jgi:endonuclease YncB( thermonuclease family)
MKHLSIILSTILSLGGAAGGQIVEAGNQNTEKIIAAPQDATLYVTGKVVAVHDGNTISFQEADGRRRTVSLIGIDAPPIKRLFGKESRKQLSALVFGETVTVEIIKSDRDGVIFGKVRLEGKDVNYVQLLFGGARRAAQDRDVLNPEDQRNYAEAETKARQAKRGLWARAKT